MRPTTVSRRSVLLGGAAALAAGCARATDPAPAPTPRGSVFTLGVASGDPASDGVVLWTRLARDPLSGDGPGGMGVRPVDVDWEIAEDERFSRVLARGRERADPGNGFSVHAEPRGLPPGTALHYRFRALGEISPAGLTRTAPAPGAMTPLTMAFASCAMYEHGWFTAYRRMAEDRPDLVLFLGDYLYETAPDEYRADSGNVRRFATAAPTTLEGYRLRHAQQHGDPDLQAAHAVAPWVPVFDDHEVENNWAAGVPEEETTTPGAAFLPRRVAALQAYWENMPLRAAQRPAGASIPLYRRLSWGGLATFHMLDTRQYRDDQTCGDEYPSDCPERLDPARSITGAAQERWLVDGLRSSAARWDVLGQQVVFSQTDLAAGPARGVNPDAWDGYPAERDRVVDAWVASPVRNAVVLTGDVHYHFAADVVARADDPSSPVVGTELITTSISAKGDGADVGEEVGTVLAENPHVRFGSDRRGYVLTRWTPDELRADFRVVDEVSRPGAPVRTASSFRVADGRPGLTPTPPAG